MCAFWLRCIKTKSESFASRRGRVNISGVSKIAWINVECNEDSLSVAVPSKVKKCSQACVTLVIPPWQIRCSAEGLARKEKKTIRQMAARRAKGSSNENQTMIRLSEEWSTCKAQHEFYLNAAVFIEKRLQNWYVFIHPSLIQDEKTNICSCCMSIICRSRRAKANQNARFGFMFITAQYAPEMKSGQLCLCWHICVFR